MKRIIKFYFVLFFFVVLIAFLMNGCGNSQTLQNNVESEVTFESLVENNPIDKKYASMLETDEMPYADIVRQYNEAWANEYSFTKDDLYKFFSSEECDKLSEYLESWENAEKATWQWCKSNVLESGKQGTQTNYEVIKQIGDAYRGKTIWLKKMMYLKESETAVTSDISSFKSLKFHFDGLDN